MARTLIIEDEENIRLSIHRTLAKAGHEVREAACLKDARDLIRQTDFDLVLTDVMLGSENGTDLVRELRADGFDGVIMVITAHGTIESAVAAMRDGADDYIQKPLILTELTVQAEKLLSLRRMARRLRLYERLERSREQSNEVVGDSPAWKASLALASRLARIPISPDGAAGGLPCILLLGETGVGKGVLARYIHAQGEADSGRPHVGRSDVAPFVHVNCSALPATLVEGELFGHEKGAFTDAREARQGLFEMADGGTIFLDEISEMPLELQSKLLLIVEHGIFRRVGGTRERSVHARVIAASNQDLDQRVQAGAFRRDLLYRLNAFTIRIPPLRERAQDALRIADAALERLTRRYARARLAFTPAAREAIAAHTWPGNVRELVNAVQRAAMLCEGSSIDPPDLGLGSEPPPLVEPESPPKTTAEALPPTGELVFNFDRGSYTADEVEKALLKQALQWTKGNISQAAKLIGMQRSSMRYRIERYHLEPYVTEVARK